MGAGWSSLKTQLTHRTPMKFVKDLFTSKNMYIGLAIGLVLALGFSRFIPRAVQSAVQKLPGAQ